MRFKEILEAKPVPTTQPAVGTAKTTQPPKQEPKPEPDAQFASRDQVKQLAANLVQDMPDVRFEVKSKSGLPYIRVFGSDKQTITNYFYNSIG